MKNAPVNLINQHQVWSGSRDCCCATDVGSVGYTEGDTLTHALILQLMLLLNRILWLRSGNNTK